MQGGPLRAPIRALYHEDMSGNLNIVKLCVGCDDPTQLQLWQRQRWGDANPQHVTRMWPRREAELLDGGSIYWVFKGTILARQRILALNERISEDGIRRCALVLEPQLWRTAATPRRPFQGWRYLPGNESPPDLPADRAEEPSLPPEIARALSDMGLR